MSPRLRGTGLSLALAVGLLSCHTRDSGSRPNIVLISIDSLRADHLHAYGYPRRTSPGIDDLARRGVLFETVTSSSSWTLPAHAALFTGLPDSAHGADRESGRLAPERRTLAEALQVAGYRTLGVWTGPLLDPRFGLAQGFDEYVSHAAPDATKPAPPWDEAVDLSHRAVTGPETLRAVDALLETNTDRPFFLFVHLWDVHYDYIPPPPYDEMFTGDYSGEVDGRDLVDLATGPPANLSERDVDHLVALYDGEVAWTDLQVSLLIRRLDHAGGAAETVVVVTADHGEEFFEHGVFGHRRQLFEESIRIPLVIAGAGIPAGLRISEPARIVDVAPTLLELAGAPPLPDVMGRSLLARIDGTPALPEPAVAELVENEDTGGGLLAVRTAEWKVLLRPSAGVTLGLWDLQTDPHERTNLLGVDADLMARVRSTVEPALEELERLRLRHAGQARPGAELDEAVRRQLESLGYLRGKPEQAESAVLSAAPNPARACDGSTVGATTLSWAAPPGAGPLELRIGSPAGRLFATGGHIGSATTGEWVTDGMTFYLVAPASGEVVARQVVRLTGSGCPAGASDR